jgi:preprotein translocase subunit SecG
MKRLLSGKRREVNTMEIALIVLEVLVSLALILIVLFQSGKEAGLGALSGNSDTYLSKSKNASLDKKLASATKWIALVWILLTLSLSLIR